MDRADRDPVAVTESRIEHLKGKVATVKEQIQRLRQISEQMTRAPDGQVSLTDPDARSMATSGRGTGIVGYNVQTAVDAQHHLIVCHEVTNVGHDRTQLSCMAKQTRDAIGVQKLMALADRGYFKGEEVLECAQAGINVLVPKPQTSNNQARGQFDKRDFRYWYRAAHASYAGLSPPFSLKNAHRGEEACRSRTFQSAICAIRACRASRPS